MSTHVTLSSGDKIPIFGLGTWQSNPGEVGNAVKEAIRAGYRHIDCAAIYGNEKEVGGALKELFDSGIVTRQDIWITSKLWNSEHKPEHVKEAVARTLSDLGIDYLDLYLIHFPLSWERGEGIQPVRDSSGSPVYLPVPIHVTWAAMEAEVKAGRIRNIGISNFGAAQMMDIWNSATIKPVVNQVECHPFLNQQALVHVAKKFGIVIEAYSPLGTGSSDLLGNEVVVSVAKRHNISPGLVLLRYHVQRGIVVLGKSVTKSRIIDNFRVYDVHLDDQDMEALNGLNRPGIRYCNPIEVFGLNVFG